MKYIIKFLQFVGLYKKPKSHEELLESISFRLKEVKNELVDLIPNQFKSDFRDESFISGGCIYSLYRNQEPKDFDFFLRDHNLASQIWSFFNELAEHKGAKISGGMYKGLPLIVTDNAVSIGKYQIITKFTGIPEEVINEFDYKHNMYYWNDYEVIALDGFDHLKSKELKYNGNRARDIVGTIIRVPKFVQRGMSMSSKEMAKILLKLHEVGFNERELEILRDSSSEKHFGS